MSILQSDDAPRAMNNAEEHFADSFGDHFLSSESTCPDPINILAELRALESGKSTPNMAPNMTATSTTQFDFDTSLFGEFTPTEFRNYPLQHRRSLPILDVEQYVPTRLNFDPEPIFQNQEPLRSNALFNGESKVEALRRTHSRNQNSTDVDVPEVVPQHHQNAIPHSQWYMAVEAPKAMHHTVPQQKRQNMKAPTPSKATHSTISQRNRSRSLGKISVPYQVMTPPPRPSSACSATNVKSTPSKPKKYKKKNKEATPVVPDVDRKSPHRSCDAPGCNKLFLCASKLTRHKLTHSGVKPFGCYCGQRFSQKSSLKVHSRRHAIDGIQNNSYQNPHTEVINGFAVVELLQTRSARSMWDSAMFSMSPQSYSSYSSGSERSSPYSPLISPTIHAGTATSPCYRLSPRPACSPTSPTTAFSHLDLKYGGESPTFHVQQ